MHEFILSRKTNESSISNILVICNKYGLYSEFRFQCGGISSGRGVGYNILHRSYKTSDW